MQNRNFLHLAISGREQIGLSQFSVQRLKQKQREPSNLRTLADGHCARLLWFCVRARLRSLLRRLAAAKSSGAR